MGQGQGKDDSVYDFLYVDQRRIGMILSQFGQDGVLTELIREAASGSESGRELDLKIVKVSGGDDESKSLTRRFDPQWLIPLIFLDQAKNRINRDIEKASLGQLVLVEGDLWLTETSMLQTMLSDGPLRGIALEKAKENAATAGTEFSLEMFDFEIDLVSRLPPQVQFHLEMTNGSVWSTLRPEGLLTPAGELAVKHGVILDGKWHVVGIKDAIPEPTRSLPDSRGDELAARYPDRLLLADTIHLAEASRRMFGRPYHAYGLSPLLIFRPVG